MDEITFKKHFLPLHSKLYRIAYALTENSQDAEDILQDTYCKLWDKRKELVQIHNPEAYCVTLLKNLCFDFLRSPKNKRNEETIETIQISNNEAPDKAILFQEQAQQLEQIIDSLPAGQRQVLRLKGISDCSLEEIEEITGFTAVNVRVLLSRARKIVREQLEKIACYER